MADLEILEQPRTASEGSDSGHESDNDPIRRGKTKRRRSRKRRNSSGSQTFTQPSSNGQVRGESREETEGGGGDVQQQPDSQKQDILPIQGDHQARFYSDYRKVADEYDKEFLKKYDEDLNTTLIFAGLFSAVTSAFIIEVDSQLQPDPGDETAALLRVLIYEINNAAFGDNIPTLPQWAGPPATMVHVQAILFTSLAVSLLSAFLAMLGKQWLNRYASTNMRGSAVERSQNRQRKLDGVIAWYFDHVMESLPLMLQAGLLLLGCALSLYLWEISIVIASVVTGVTSVGVIFYLFAVVAGAVSESCPYQTPGSHALRYLGPKVWRIIRSVPSSAVSVRPTLPSALRNAFKQSRVVEIFAKNAETYHPWLSRREILPFFRHLVLQVPLGFAIDVYHLGRVVIRGFTTLSIGAYRLVRSADSRLYGWYLTLQQILYQRTTPPDFRCISWTLQTSLDKPIHLTSLEYLGTKTELTGLDPILVVDCFNVFVACLGFSNHKLVVIQGLEPLATVSVGCFFHTLHHLLVTDPTSSVLSDLRRRFNGVFPPGLDFTDLPFNSTVAMIYVLVGPVGNHRNIQWHGYRPPNREHIPFARFLVEAARVGYQQTQYRKVPRWILRFVLHTLALDPPSPASVVADCLTIIAIDLGCDLSNLVTLDEGARVEQVSNLITQKLKVMVDALPTDTPRLLWPKYKAIAALFPYTVYLGQRGEKEVVDAVSRTAKASEVISKRRGSWERKRVRIRPANTFSGSIEGVDTSQVIQGEATLRFPQTLLDPTESKVVVSSLALISSSPPHKFPKSAVVSLNLTLESSFREAPCQAQTDVVINCILVLGGIKYQSVVDRNWDQDHNVGGIPVTPLVAWAAQQFTINAFDENSNILHSEGIRVRLLTAATWLSPVDAREDMMPDGEKLKIQDRWEFVKQLRVTLAKHVCSDDPGLVDKKVLINLINGMHACIPRGDYGSASSFVSFLPLICEDYDSPWSEDESVLRALITYALDLLSSPKTRTPLVERGIEFDELASELIDVLMVNTTSPDTVALGFWLIYRVPYAFKSRKSMLADIVYIWASANESIPQDLRRRMTFYAVDAFVAIAQCHVSANRTLPKISARSTLNLLQAALEDSYTRPMATYAVAMILHLGTPTQTASFVRGFDAELFTRTLYTVRKDLEQNATEEDIVELRIYSTLVLFKLRQPRLDVEKVEALIGEVERAIGDPISRDSDLAEDSRVDLYRVKWKAIYLCGLLFALLPPGEQEGAIESVRERVRGLWRSGELHPAGDYERCIEPLDMGPLELRAPTEERPLYYTVFGGWAKEFPFFPLVGSVSTESHGLNIHKRRKRQKLYSAFGGRRSSGSA